MLGHTRVRPREGFTFTLRVSQGPVACTRGEKWEKFPQSRHVRVGQDQEWVRPGGPTRNHTVVILFYGGLFLYLLPSGNLGSVHADDQVLIKNELSCHPQSQSHTENVFFPFPIFFFTHYVFFVTVCLH